MKPRPASIPRHIAIILDGNGRWARQRGLARIFGHEEGAKAVRQSVEGCGELGVEFLTLYAFSQENWQRPEGGGHRAHAPAAESSCKRHHAGADQERNVRLQAIGRTDQLPDGLPGTSSTPPSSRRPPTPA